MQVRTRIPVSLDLSVAVSQTTGPGDIPHRRGSVSGTGPLAPQSRGTVPDSETVPYFKQETMVKDMWFTAISFCLALYNILFSGATVKILLT